MGVVGVGTGAVDSTDTMVVASSSTTITAEESEEEDSSAPLVPSFFSSSLFTTPEYSMSTVLLRRMLDGSLMAEDTVIS